MLSYIELIARCLHLICLYFRRKGDVIDLDVFTCN